MAKEGLFNGINVPTANMFLKALREEIIMDIVKSYGRNIPSINKPTKN